MNLGYAFLYFVAHFGLELWSFSIFEASLVILSAVSPEQRIGNFLRYSHQILLIDVLQPVMVRVA